MNSSTFTEIPIPEDGASNFLAWLDFDGADALRLLHEGKVDVIHWNITDAERFEKVKNDRGIQNSQKVLCVTSQHPDQDPPPNQDKKNEKSFGTRVVRLDPKGLVLNFFYRKYRPYGGRSRYGIGDTVYLERDMYDRAVIWVGGIHSEKWILEVKDEIE